MSRPAEPARPAGTGDAGDEAGDLASLGAVADAVLDARGLRCPLPVIRLARLVSDDPSAQVVTVLATDPAAAHDIPAWCRMRGHTYLGAQGRNGYTAHHVRVRSRRPAEEP